MIAAASLSAGVLVAAGVYLLLSLNVQRLVLGFLLASNGINLLVIASGGLPPRPKPPVLGVGGSGTPADPLPQAFILTAIVIGLGAAAFLLAMAVRTHRATRSDLLREEGER